MRRSVALSRDDLDVAFEVCDVRQTVVERDEVAQAVDGLQFVVTEQFVGDCDAVDLSPRW